MNYRDDRDALRGQVENLQQELETARADQERLRDVDKRLEAAKRELHALETELGRTRKKPKSAAPIALVTGMVMFTMCAGAAAFLVARRPLAVSVSVSPPPIATVAPPPPVTPPPIVPMPPGEPKPSRMVHVTWKATVTKSTDATVHAGASCTIDAEAVPDSSGMHVVDVAVRCGGQEIYNERGHLDGMSMLDSGAREHPDAKSGMWVYDLIYSDTGTRSETRNQAKLDSALKIGRVWSDNMPDFRIDLAIRAGSDPVGVSILDP